MGATSRMPRRWGSLSWRATAALRRTISRSLLALALVAAAALFGPVSFAQAATAPKITLQPVSQTVEEGQPASFTASASGTPTPTVQWEVSTNSGVSWTPIAAATETTYSIASASTSETGWQFRAVFTNSAGKATSKAATLTVRRFPFVTQQPVSATVEEGQPASFEATAGGFPAPTVQWQLSKDGGGSWTNISGATSTRFTIASAKTTETGREFRAVFTNAAGKVTSEAATLTVQNAPKITKQPVSKTADEGESVSFEAAASGFPAPGAQWESSTDGGATWTPVAGATSATLTISPVTVAEDGTMLRAVFSNAAGQATTNAVTLTVHAPPLISEQPSSVTILAGETATFQAAASGHPTPTIQWQLSTNGGSTWAPVGGATSEQLTVPEAQASESGHQYRAVFTNAAGTATSHAAVLTVATTKFSALGWGQNLYRQLGDGTANALSASPDPVSGLTFVTAAAAGGRHSLALLADGTVDAWGNDAFDQLGDGGGVASEVPVQVAGLTGVKAIAAGAYHSLALLSNGTVMAWGDNESGQLGDGKTTAEGGEGPVAVKGLSNVKAIAAGGETSLALLSNGTVMAWGAGEEGQLGNGGAKSSTTPVAVKGLTGVSAVSTGGSFGLALLGSGGVEAWGGNEYGQLGDPEFEEAQRNVPGPVSGLSGVSAVAAGESHALALLGDGTVRAWGRNSAGELGNGSMSALQAAPVAVSGLSGVSAVSAGGQDSAALLGSGSIMTWGIDEWGTLGDGTTGSPSDVPVPVQGVAKAASVSAGTAHMLAFGEPVPTVAHISPAIGPSSGGTTVTITGVKLEGASAVKFGAAEASSFTVESATEITAVAPPGSGTVDITVSTPSGTSHATPADRFTYEPPPAVTKLSPKTGSAAGGTTVTITGSTFVQVGSVTFGGVPAAGYTVLSPTTITAVAPAHAVGTADVVVQAAGGTSALTSADHFKYTPTVEAVEPAGGPAAGGTVVTVTGTGFALGTATTFKFGTTKATAVDCTSTTTCTMHAPAHEVGTVDVRATVSKVASPINPADRYTYS